MIHVKHTDRYDNWHFGGPTHGMRSRLATKQFLDLVDPALVTVTEPDPTTQDHLRSAVALGVHDDIYVRRVAQGYSDEWGTNGWDDQRPDLGTLAVTMFNGTAELLREVQPGELGINWQGAKHHAMFDHSSGFCVLNDMAFAAKLLALFGNHVFYLDWDAHHGDGVEKLTRTDPLITTFSIHERGIFPGTGLVDSPGENVYNRALAPGSGNLELVAAVTEALASGSGLNGTSTILLAAGADGHRRDPLSSLRYTIEGYREAAKMVGEAARDLGARVIMGGAGGYRPEDATPKVWAATAQALAESMGLT